MTKLAWEYLYVTYTYRYETSRHYPMQAWTHIYKISRRDSELETLEGEKPTWAELLHRFGGEGWELVSERVGETTIVKSSAGWKGVAIPVTIAWTFKRPAASS
jgi:hypothetical protein